MTGKKIWLLPLAVLLLAACVPAGRQPSLPQASPVARLAATNTGPAATFTVTAATGSAAPPTAPALPVAPSSPTATAVPSLPTSVPLPQPSPSLTPVPAATAGPTATPPPPAGPTTAPTAAPAPALESPGATSFVETLLVAPGQPGRLYALVQKGIGPLWAFPAAEVRLLISDDFARSWSPFPGGLPVPPACMINISLDYFPPTVLYAHTCQGLYVWQDAGWQRRSQQLTNLLAVVYGQPESMWAAEPGKGVIRSDDGGRTWHDFSAGLVNFGGMVALGIDARDANIVYGMVRPKYAGSWLRRASGSQWQTMPAPLDNTAVDMGVAIDGATGAFYVTTLVSPVQLWRSRNANTMDVAAVQWELVHDFGDRVQVRLLASGWSPQGMALYANFWPLTPSPGGGASVGSPALYRSLDGGATWQPLALP